MKATNNSRKIIKMVIFLMLLFLITFNAFSQKSFDKNSFNEIIANIFQNSKADIIEAFTLSWDSKQSEEVMIEDWMNNPSEWSVKSEPALSAIPEFLNEELSEIEDWMTKPDWNILLTEEIPLENWMINPDCWNINSNFAGKDSRKNQSCDIVIN